MKTMQAEMGDPWLRYACRNFVPGTIRGNLECYLCDPESPTCSPPFVEGGGCCSHCSRSCKGKMVLFPTPSLPPEPHSRADSGDCGSTYGDDPTDPAPSDGDIGACPPDCGLHGNYLHPRCDGCPHPVGARQRA